MNLGTPGAQLFWSLLIGAEVFAIAALWPVSEWAATATRGRWLLLALGVMVACIGFDTRAAAIARLAVGPDRWVSVDTLLAWFVVPLFVAFPDAVCVASAQSLRYAGVPATVARVVSLFAAAFAVIVAPFAAVAAGCGLAGACF